MKIAWITTICCLTLLMGCKPGSTNQPTGDSPEVKSSEPAATRSFIDASGEIVTIPTAPKRIIVLSEVDLDVCLALGVQPVGTINGRGQNSPPNYLQDKRDGITIIGDFPKPNVDKVIALKPDLILVGGYVDAGILRMLKKISPVCMTWNMGDNWPAALKTIGSILNLEAEAEAVLASYNEAVIQAKASLPHIQGKTASIVRWNPKGPAYMYQDSFAATVLHDLGFARPEHQSEKGMGHGPPLSFEALDRIDADWIFLGTLSPAGEAADAMKAALDMPAFKQLKAVKSNQMIVVDGSLWTSLAGPIGARYIIDRILQTTQPAPQ